MIIIYKIRSNREVNLYLKVGEMRVGTCLAETSMI